MHKFLVLSFVFIGLKSQTILGDTFKVAFPFLPKFNPITNQINIANYIAPHLYSPLFEVKENGELISQFLDLSRSKALDRSFTNFVFCLKDQIKFNDHSEITVNDFYGSFNLFAQMYPHLVPLKSIQYKSARCLNIQLMHSVPGLFKKLTGTASTILKVSQLTSDFPVGLGSYNLESISDDKVVLKFAGQIKIRYDKIEFVKISTKFSDDSFEFQDLNHLPKTFLNENFHKKDDAGYEAPISKIYALVINLKEEKKRNCVISLLSKVDWKKAYQLPVEPTKSFLPWNSSIPRTQLKYTTLPICKDFLADLYVPDLYDAKQVQSIVASAGLREKIIIRKVSNDEFGQRIFSGKSYIGLIGFDATTSIATLEGDFSTYFESFLSIKNRIISTPPAKLRKLIFQATKVNSTKKLSEKMFELAEAELIQKGFLLPVGRMKKGFYFAKGLSIKKWFDHVNGIPDISAIE